MWRYYTPWSQKSKYFSPPSDVTARGSESSHFSDQDRQLLADSHRALNEEPTVFTFTPPEFIPPPFPPDKTQTPSDLEAHWEAVKPQLKLAENLNETQREELLAVLKKHATAFSSHPGDLGLVNNTFHHINTGNSRPVRMQAYRQSFAEKAEIDQQVKPMEDWGVVRPSASPFAAAVVLARKKNGKWRFCVDFRGLNRETVQDNYPLPRIDAIFDQLGKSRYFTMLDAQSGYWQIPMAPEDIHKTAFITHRGLREFVRMPFGLTGAPATYQRMMDVTLQEELHGPNPVATQYLDDTCVHTVLWADHLQALDRILAKIVAINLKLCPTKCLFGASEAEHLGHIVRENQLLPEPDKIRAISEWMTPINVSEVRSFLGMVGYYRHFIANFSRIAKPLHHLTKLGVVFEWGHEQTTAFETLKAALCSSPILIRPDPAIPFIVDTDYSTDGIGATLSQRGADGQEHPVAFASRSLHGAEVNYSTTDGELLALVWAVTVKFRPYLFGGPTFTCRVDHNPLVYLHQQRNLTGRLARWHMKLMEYNFTVVHRPGLVHSNVDPLSRHPIQDTPADNWDDLPAYASFPVHGLPSDESPTVLNIEDQDTLEALNFNWDTDCYAPPAFEWEPEASSPPISPLYVPTFGGAPLSEQSPTVNYCEPSSSRYTRYSLSRGTRPPTRPSTPPREPTHNRARDVSDLQGDSQVPQVRPTTPPSPSSTQMFRLASWPADRPSVTYEEWQRLYPDNQNRVRMAGWPSDRPGMTLSEWLERQGRELPGGYPDPTDTHHANGVPTTRALRQTPDTPTPTGEQPPEPPAVLPTSSKVTEDRHEPPDVPTLASISLEAPQTGG